MNRYLTLSWIAFAAVGIIIVGFLFLIFGIDLSGPPKILLPDSAILQPVLDSPEGKAFTTRYPDYKASVLQDFYMSRCCQVTLWYYPPTTNSRPAIQLLVYVSVSGDLKTISVDNDVQLRCIVSEGSWAVKGNIVQNLQPDKPDCWKSGPPPKASDQELIEIASNTTAGKKYLARYPENDITISRDRDINVGYKVTFTPKISEPIELIINVAGFDREITLTYLICSYGAYRYPQQPEFWSYFEPSNDCLQSVHDKLVVADKTPQAKAFKEKYPGVGLHRTDSSGKFTVRGTNSTVTYMFGTGNDAILIIHFKPGTTSIVNFEAQCGPEPTSAGTAPQHTQSGIDLNVTTFLQDSYCPTS